MVQICVLVEVEASIKIKTYFEVRSKTMKYF